MGNGAGHAPAFPQHEGMSLEITEELIARQPPEAQAIIRALLAKIQELQDRLKQSPRNSSSPPSSEHPHAKPPRPQPRATRLRGGQPGHPRHERPLLPTEEGPQREAVGATPGNGPLGVESLEVTDEEHAEIGARWDGLSTDAVGVVRLTETLDVGIEAGLGEEGIELVIEDVARREG